MTGAEDPRLVQLVDFVVQLAAGDLAARLTPSPAGDSVDAAVVGLNMLAEELGVLYTGLEQHVAERTALLEAAQAELQHLALSDALTDLANRTLLGDRIAQAVARCERGALPPIILVVDLDGFKLINDSFGHGGGDMVLVEVARRLRDVARQTDTVARLGGDEFAILIIDTEPTDALRIAERVLEQLQLPVAVDDEMACFGASVGVCVGLRHQSAESLLRDADTALYAAKARGRNNIQLFKPAMRTAALARLQVTGELQAALNTDELIVHYQPLLDLAAGTVVGAEALVRWRHPHRGLLLPDEFIPRAETGLIGKVGQRVLLEGIRQLRQWQQELALPASFRLHVNTSPVQFRSPGLVPFVLDTLTHHHVHASSLVLEITENGLMTDEDEITQALRDLRSAGVGLAIDDFGTGYSSISNLRRLPVDTVKIDRSLVAGIDTDPQQRRLLSAIIQLIAAVSLTPIAEGVETAEQGVQLRALGCPYGQGHHLGRPVAADEMTELLRRDLDQRGLRLPGVFAP